MSLYFPTGKVGLLDELLSKNPNSTVILSATTPEITA
jgi:hypothetical protein